MSTTAPKPATTPMPVQLSEPEFTAFLLPHLAMPKRGPQCKLGYHRVFHLILWLLYTGMQWQCVPIPPDANGKPAIHDTTIYKVFATWADDGSLWQALVASIRHLAAEKQLAIGSSFAGLSRCIPPDYYPVSRPTTTASRLRCFPLYAAFPRSSGGA
jgi:transposase